MKVMTYGDSIKRFISLSFSFVLSFMILNGVSFAETQDFPKKEITFNVNMGPGGGRDIISRGIGKVLSKYLKAPVIIVNQPGAGGSKGHISLFHAPPDGYTIGLGAGSDITNQIFDKQQQYDNRKFTFIGRVQSEPSMLFVRTASPFHSLQDFKTYGKPIRHSTQNMFANITVVSMIIANREKWPLSIIGGYKSSSDAILSVIRGDAEYCGLTLTSSQQFVRAGQIRPILAIAQKRLPNFPDIPTVSEVGHPDMGAFTTDYWVIAPPGLSKARAKILEEALFKAINDPDFVKWAKVAGVDINPASGEETRQKVLNIFSLLQQYRGDIEKYLN